MNKQTLKTHIFFSLLLILNISIYAKSRSSAEALSIANSFYQSSITTKSISTKSSTDNVGLTLAYSCTDGIATRSSNENAYYYIFNRGDNNGFIIISGDDRAKSVLGYSDSGSFSATVIPENFKNWMSSYQKELKALAAISEDATSTMQSSSVLSATTKAISFSTSISPLLGTIAWNQLSPYNILCPKIGASRAPTGCVATAMAQIMKYYQWPVQGAGSKKYKPASMIDSLYVDFSKTAYNWPNMKNAYRGNSTAIQDTAVATLMYHCGVSVDMDYTVYSSAAYSNYIPAALNQYFGYDSNIQIYSRDFYTEAEWLQMIKTELNASRPILYGGSSTSEGGHQFICDGYDTNNLFHFNWGWGGYYDGYFELSSLNYETPGIGGSVTDGFTVWQDMVTGIQKPTTTSSKSYEIYLIKK
jgi:Peptidase C10 family.